MNQPMKASQRPCRTTPYKHNSRRLKGSSHTDYFSLAQRRGIRLVQNSFVATRPTRGKFLPPSRGTSGRRLNTASARFVCPAMQPRSDRLFVMERALSSAQKSASEKAAGQRPAIAMLNTWTALDGSRSSAPKPAEENRVMERREFL